MADADRDRWNRRFAAQERITEPSEFLLSLDPLLPRAGRALDVAGGAGRHSVWLAGRGLSVTLADISDVGIARAKAAARERGVSIDAVEVDFERDGLPKGPWELILCFNYLERRVFAPMAHELSPGGLLVVLHPTRRNLEKHENPPAPRLLAEGELPQLVKALEVVRYEERWFEGYDGGPRHEARLVARAPSAPGR